MTDIIKISSNSKMVEIDLKNPETPTTELIEEEKSANRVCINDIVGNVPLRKVKIKDFINIYNKELDILFSEDEKVSDTAHIFGYPIHIIWNGYIVDIGDGATPTNALIPALEEMDDEWGGEL